MDCYNTLLIVINVQLHFEYAIQNIRPQYQEERNLLLHYDTLQIQNWRITTLYRSHHRENPSAVFHTSYVVASAQGVKEVLTIRILYKFNTSVKYIH